MTKKDDLIMLFPEVNDSLPIDKVLMETGITTMESLKTYCWDLRKKNIIDLKLKWGFCKRIK